MEFLKQDEIIPGQETALISMIEPRNEKLLRRRESWLATNFIQWFVKEHQQAVIFELKQKHKNKKITNEFIQEKLNMSFDNVEKLYKEYLSLNITRLDDRFNRLHNKKDELTISGIKIRGIFPDDDDLIKRQINKFHEYENYVDIYKVPVGKWVPYCPKTDKGIKVDYLHDKLNNILKDYHDINKNNKQMFENRLNDVNKNDNKNNKKEVPDEVRKLPFTQPNIQVPRPPVPSKQNNKKSKIKEIIPETDEFKD